jgi:hypothetical protein
MALTDRRPFFGIGAIGETCTPTSKNRDFYSQGVQFYIDKYFQKAYDLGYRRFIYWLPAGGYTEVISPGACIDEDGDGEVERVGLEKSQSFPSSTIDALNWISPGGRGEIPPDFTGYPFRDVDSNFGYSSIPNHVGNSDGPCAPVSPNCYPENNITPGINPDAINYFNDIISPDGALQSWLDGLNDNTVEFSFYVGYKTVVDQNPLINFIKTGVKGPDFDYGPLNPRLITPELTFEKTDGTFESFREYIDRNISPLLSASRSPVGYPKRIYFDNGSAGRITPRIQDPLDPTGGSRYNLREFSSFIKSSYGAEVVTEAIPSVDDPTTPSNFPTKPDYNFIPDGGALAINQFLDGDMLNTQSGRDQGTWNFAPEYSSIFCMFSRNGSWFWDRRFNGAASGKPDGLNGVVEAFKEKINQGYIVGSNSQSAINVETNQVDLLGIAANLMKWLKNELIDVDGNVYEYEDAEGNTKYPYLELP